ncbi:hypothetical protein FRC04_007920 [Tulasnella sp. 424]|nr:hypothetical protein FRC04_007920 [Tulasnella sp. 424]KAG8959464.1 hypothetical protein FRC05_007729 [Tulasnella sp. 425]
MSFVGCVTTTSKPAFGSNQTRRTPSIGLLGQNTQQQQVVAKGPSGGVQQPPTRLPDNALEPSSKPDAEAPGSVFGTTGPNVIRSSEGSSGQLQSTADGLVGKEAPRAQTRPPSSVVLGNQATLSRNSSIYLPHRSSSLLTQQSLSPSLLDGTHDSARRSSINTPSYPESTQVAARSQTPLQSQLIASQSQPTLPDSIWKRVLENKPKALQREGSSQSDLSCATTEPASREPSPLLHEGRDPSLPVPVPRMPGLTYSFGRTEIEHAPSPPVSPRSRALSMGLKERDFAYEDFPGKAEHQKALAARKAARLAVIGRKTSHTPVPLAALYPKRYNRETASQSSQPATHNSSQPPYLDPHTRNEPSTSSISNTSEHPKNPSIPHTGPARGPAPLTRRPTLVFGTTAVGNGKGKSVGVLVFDSDEENEETAGSSSVDKRSHPRASSRRAVTPQEHLAPSASSIGHIPVSHQGSCTENSDSRSDSAFPDLSRVAGSTSGSSHAMTATGSTDVDVATRHPSRSPTKVLEGSSQASQVLHNDHGPRMKDRSHIVATARHQVSKSVEQRSHFNRTASLVPSASENGSSSRPEGGSKRKRQDSQVLESAGPDPGDSHVPARSSRSARRTRAATSSTSGASRAGKKLKAEEDD